MVDGDAQTLGLLAADTSLLELRERETTTLADLGVVSDRRATDGRAKRLQRADTERECLLDTVLPTAVLAARLVEPGLDPALHESTSGGVSG